MKRSCGIVRHLFYNRFIDAGECGHPAPNLAGRGCGKGTIAQVLPQQGQ